MLLSYQDIIDIYREHTGNNMTFFDPNEEIILTDIAHIHPLTSVGKMLKKLGYHCIIDVWIKSENSYRFQ